MVVLFVRKNRKIIVTNKTKCYDTTSKEVGLLLIEYKVKNFMSFRDEIILSMVADKNRELSSTNVFKQGNFELLKCAAVFGANASGKTNLIESFLFLDHLFRPTTNMEELINDLPYFQLNTENENMPISFELSFFLGGKRHRYGIEIGKNGIESEWLYFVPSRQEACYFIRAKNEIRPGTYFENKKALDYIQPDPNRPFLYTLGQHTVKQFERAKNILNYLKFYIRSTHAPFDLFKNLIEKAIIKDPDNDIVPKKEVVNFLRAFDISISDLSVKEVRSEEGLQLRTQSDEYTEENNLQTFMHHPKFDNQFRSIGEVEFPLTIESWGTIKLYALLYPIFYVLKRGGVLLIDEIESSLHPLICDRIIRMFNDPILNPNNAQFIFTSHNALLMDPKLLRRDQIYFVEKDKYGASSLYSLYDLALDVRSNFNYVKNYLTGRFGAIPYFDDFQWNSSS